MRILIACEESQACCKAFRERGHEAYSADLYECSGGKPEWHIQGDCLPLLNGCCEFTTQDGTTHTVDGRWDMILAFPPCTYLTITGNRWFNVERYGEKAEQRHRDRDAAAEFFMQFVNADCDKIVIENPIGCMSTRYRKPEQVIHPYHYGHPERKATCLWLKGLPLLKHGEVVEPIVIQYANGTGTDNPWHVNTLNLPPAERARARSKTWPGIAQAMAEQWG